MNVDFKGEDYRFNARASAIILNKDKTKMLLYRVNDGRYYYLLPGGRIEMYEDSKTSIKREIFEETGWDLDFNLCAIQENFIYKKDKKIMQYCFCYKAIYEGEIAKEKFACKDNPNQFFSWLDLKELPNTKIYPASTKELLNEDSIKHFVENIKI